MIWFRPIVLVAGMAALVVAAPCSAVSWPSPKVDETAGNPAMQLLQTAAWNSMARPWTAVQRVITVQDGWPRMSAMEVDHRPGVGSEVRLLSDETRAVAGDLQQTALLEVLMSNYDVVLAGKQWCAGKRATLLEARRPDVDGPGAVAGRFWLDPRTGMVLRRDVHDDRGAVVRSTTYDGLQVGAPGRLPDKPAASTLDDGWLEAMKARGWPVRRTLPGNLDLYDARLHDEADRGVLQLSYSDGLSTVSLFVQPGELPDEPAGTPRPLEDGGTVWVTAGTPERLVWSGGGRTWTLLTDAPETTVRAALMALPHHPAKVEDSMPSRVWRGMAVVGGWLNPFR